MVEDSLNRRKSPLIFRIQSSGGSSASTEYIAYVVVPASRIGSGRIFRSDNEPVVFTGKIDPIVTVGLSITLYTMHNKQDRYILGGIPWCVKPYFDWAGI